MEYFVLRLLKQINIDYLKQNARIINTIGIIKVLHVADDLSALELTQILIRHFCFTPIIKCLSFLSFNQKLAKAHYWLIIVYSV